MQMLICHQKTRALEAAPIALTLSSSPRLQRNGTFKCSTPRKGVRLGKSYLSQLKRG